MKVKSIVFFFFKDKENVVVHCISIAIEQLYE